MHTVSEIHMPQGKKHMHAQHPAEIRFGKVLYQLAPAVPVFPAVCMTQHKHSNTQFI